jgi:type I restriction enzyme, S subunit
MFKKSIISDQFKDSPLGKIPSDWEIEELGDIFKLTSGKTKPKTLLENPINEKSYPVYGGNGILGYSFEYNSNGEIIIIGRVGEYCGITRYLNELCWITDNALYTKEFLVDIDIKYLSYKLQQEDISKLRSKGGQPLVSQTPIHLHKIALPKSLPEQKAIAHVLGLMDSTINTNNQLIAKKELQKKWLMQNLLTGRKRLKGFSGEWNEYLLKNCFHFIKSYSISRDGLSREQGKYYCIHYGDIHAYFETDFIDFKTQLGIPRINDSKVSVNTGDYLNDGDIIIADASEDYEGVGEAVEVINIQDKIVIGGLHTIVLRDFSGVTSNLFRAYLFNSERVRNELRKKATGTSVYSVTKTTLESLVFKLPPLNEQQSIAMTLQAADLEIQILKSKTEKFREQKKGLMQVLLTGKKRLKVPAIK